MGKQRQNIQLELAFMSEGRGETPRSNRKGTELRWRSVTPKARRYPIY